MRDKPEIKDGVTYIYVINVTLTGEAQTRRNLKAE